jgi:hypothetical protein
MLVTVAITETSYRYIEMPIRRGAIGNWLRRERRRPSRATVARRRQLAALGVLFTVLLGWAGVSIAMAPNRCVGEVECSLIDPSADPPTNSTIEIGDGQTTTTTAEDGATPQQTVPGDGVTTTVTTVAPTTTVPVDQRPPISVGESVMLGAKPQLEAGGFTVYAEESHQADWIISVVGQLRAAGQIGKTIVIQTGTNGQVTAEQYDQIMSFLPAAEVPTVVFLTVRAPGKGWIDGNNELIRALPSKYPNQVKVLEWKGLVDSDQIPGMAGDGTHLGTVAAKQTYANYIFDTIGRRDLVLPVE